MARKPIWVVIVVLVAFGIGWILIEGLGGRRSPEDLGAIASKDEKGTEPAPALPMPPETTPSPQARTQGGPFIAHQPDPATYRREVEADPVGLPPSLGSFVAAIAHEMELARKNIQEARRVSLHLRACALTFDPARPVTVPGTCAANLRSLARQYPEMLAYWEETRSMLAPEVRRVLPPE